MAGGQDLLTEMKDHLVEPEAVVNLKHIPGLDTIHYDGKTGLHIGALVKVAEVAEFQPASHSHFPALAQAAEVIGSPQIRHAGTMGGNLCQRPRCWYYRNEHIVCLKKGGDRCYAAAGENKYNAILGGGPSFIVHPSDTATALVALGASVTIAGPTGTRNVPLEQFFILPTENVLRGKHSQAQRDRDGTFWFPQSPLAAHSAYLKFREKMSMDWAMSACAVALYSQRWQSDGLAHRAWRRSSHPVALAESRSRAQRQSGQRGHAPRRCRSRACRGYSPRAKWLQSASDQNTGTSRHTAGDSLGLGNRETREPN